LDLRLWTLDFRPIQRAPKSQSRPVHHVRIDLRRRHIHMPEQILDAADIRPALQQVRGETVPQRMGRHPLVEPGPACRRPDRHLKRPVQQVVAPVHP